MPALPDAADFPWPNGAKAAFSLSFDDATPSHPDIAIPILDQYSFKATFFVMGNQERIPLRLEEWKKAVAAGHEIGNHLVNHPCSGNFPWIDPGRALENYTLDQIEDEIVEANALIHEMLGTTPVSFAYPCGLDFVGRGTARRSYVHLVAGHFLVGRGYRGEYLNNPAFCDLAMVQSIGVDESTFEEMIQMIEKSITLGYWVIFALHKARPGSGPGASEENLHKLCGWLKENENRVWSNTVGEVAKFISENRSI